MFSRVNRFLSNPQRASACAILLGLFMIILSCISVHLTYTVYATRQWRSLADSYNDVWKKADPRVDNYPMMSSPWPELGLIFLYFFIICYGGPKLMENRKPYNLKNTLLAYNFAMVILSGYTFLEFGFAGWFGSYGFGCQPVDYSYSKQALRMVNVSWLFFFSKNIELLDTVFFVLRKKYNQVSFLHVYHHSIMPMSLWIGVRFVPGGFGTFQAIINSFVHFVMYFYYFMAALGPQYQKYLWWKKYLTNLQITQFVLVIIHASQLFFIDCDYPMSFAVVIVAYAFIFLLMFANFYIYAYTKKAIKKKKLSQNDNTKEAVSNGVAANGIKHD